MIGSLRGCNVLVYSVGLQEGVWCQGPSGTGLVGSRVGNGGGAPCLRNTGGPGSANVFPKEPDGARGW